MMEGNLDNFTDVFGDVDEIENSQPLSLPSSYESDVVVIPQDPQVDKTTTARPNKHTGQHGDFRSVEETDPKYRHVFTYPYFNLVQSSVIEDALYSDKSMVVCAPTGSGKTVVFEMAIIHLLMELDDKNYTGDFKIIYMAPVKALCSERLSEWYPKFTRLGLMCIEVTGDTDVDFSQLTPYRIIVTTPEKWDMLTRRWRDHRGLMDVIKLFLIDEVHILNDETRGPVLEAVVSRMKTIEESQQTAHRIEELQRLYHEDIEPPDSPPDAAHLAAGLPRIRFVAVSATVSNPEDVAAWLGTNYKPAVYYKFGDECRPVKLKRIVEGYPCPEGMSIFKFDIILNYKLWPVIQKYHDGKPTLIFCNTRKSVALTAEALSKELTINFTPEQKARLTALASTIKNRKLQALVLNGVGCHHAGLLYEERLHIEEAFRNRDLPILITTTTLAMGVNLPAHLVIIKCTQQYVNGQYQEYSISTVLQMVGRAGRPQFDTEATAVIMTRLADKPRYQALVGGDEPLQSYLHKRLPENLNSEAALGTVGDVAQCVQWLRSTFLSVRAVKDPRRYLGLPANAPPAMIYKKIEELCVKAMNGLASAGLITMDEASCIQSTEAGKLMSVFYLDLETMKQIMKIEGTETLEQLLWIICESHELSDMHLRVDERRTLNALNRNNAAATIRFPMKGKINTRQMKLNCIMQAVFGCLPISEPSLNQEAMKVMRIADRICKCLVAYVTRPDLISTQPKYFSTILNSIVLAKCVSAHLWENSPYVSKQLKGIGPTFSTLLASAGKVNFTLLEESHPRDLERIMNKGAPAGNVLRKQVGLLPKYQLTATPLDEMRVSITLMLINQNYLAENRDQLTATDAHKCYIVAGDSENHLLFFSSFRDKDLISFYDGTITLEITRKHRFEHKVFVHCASSNWVGLDVKCDYVFKSIEPIFVRAEVLHPMPVEDTCTKSKKQSYITDTYKERKRKANELDMTQCKEKKKRETPLMEQFKVLKNSFEETSKVLQGDLEKSGQMSNQLINDLTSCDIWSNSNSSIEAAMVDLTEDFPAKEPKEYSRQRVEEFRNEDTSIVDDRRDNILNEIETEISKAKTVSMHEREDNSFPVRHSLNNNKIQSTSNQFPKLDMYRHSANKAMKRKIANKRSNFSFIDKIEKNANSSQTVDDEIPQKDNGFSDSIKKQIEKFLQQTSNKNSNTNIGIRELLEPVESNHCDARKDDTKCTTMKNIPQSQYLLLTGQCPDENNAGGTTGFGKRPLLLPAVDTKFNTTLKTSENKINTLPPLQTPMTFNNGSVITTVEANDKSLHEMSQMITNSFNRVNLKGLGLEMPTDDIELDELCTNTAGVNKIMQSPELPPVYLDSHKTETHTDTRTYAEETFDPKLNKNNSSQTTYCNNEKIQKFPEPIPVGLNANESPPVDILSPPPEYEDGSTYNAQINKAGPAFFEETHSDEKNVSDISVMPTNNSDNLKTKLNYNYHEDELIVIRTANKEESTDMLELNTRDKTNQSVLEDNDSGSKSEKENFTSDLFSGEKMKTNELKTIWEVLQDNIITETEFNNILDKDTESVSNVITRQTKSNDKNYEEEAIIISAANKEESKDKTNQPVLEKDSESNDEEENLTKGTLVFNEKVKTNEFKTICEVSKDDIITASEFKDHFEKDTEGVSKIIKLKTTTNDNYHEDKAIIVSAVSKEESKDIQYFFLDPRDKTNQSVLDDDSGSNDDDEMDTLFPDGKMKTNEFKTICEVPKDDIITDTEFIDHYDEDTEAVSKIIKRIKNYENRKVTDLSRQARPKTPLQQISNIPTTTSNLQPIPETGTKISLVDRITPKPNTGTQFKAKTLKRPSFRPPLKKEMDNTCKVPKIMDGSKENSNTLRGNDYTNGAQNTPHVIPAYGGIKPAENSSQENSASTLLKKSHKKDFQYKNQYSFSATKIDVCTKDMPDHHIQIIRKVKLDLDVTEIITKIDDVAQKDTKQHINNKTLLPSHEIIEKQSESEIAPLQVHFENVNSIKCIGEMGKVLTFAEKLNCEKTIKEEPKKIEDTIKFSNINNTTLQLSCIPSATRNYELISNIKSMKDSRNNLVSTNFCDKEELRRNNCCLTTESEGQNKIVSLPYHRNSNQQSVNNHNVEQPAQNKCQAEKELNKNTKDKGRDNNSCLENGMQKIVETLLTGVDDRGTNSEGENIQLTKTETDDEIENILQKYGALLRKNSNVLNNADVKQTSQLNSTNGTTTKTKNFKLNEIFKLEIPLPKTLITAEAKRIPRLCNADMLSRVNDKDSVVETSRSLSESTGNKSAYGLKEHFSPRPCNAEMVSRANDQESMGETSRSISIGNKSAYGFKEHFPLRRPCNANIISRVNDKESLVETSGGLSDSNGNKSAYGFKKQFSPRPCNLNMISKVNDKESVAETSRSITIGNKSAYGFKEPFPLRPCNARVNDIESLVEKSRGLSDSFGNKGAYGLKEHYSDPSEKMHEACKESMTQRDNVEAAKESNLRNRYPPKTASKLFYKELQNDFQGENSEEYLSPVEVIPELATQEDFNLDQSMLNPKTLIQQCFSKDDDIIIPPPLDFCDNDDNKSDYSPTKKVNECINFPYETFNKTPEDVGSDMTGRSIFEDNTHATLTPSKEIETWTFSQHIEDDRSKLLRKNNAIQSRTVMRSVSPADAKFYLALANRRGKLGQFQFTHKKKFKL